MTGVGAWTKSTAGFVRVNGEPVRGMDGAESAGNTIRKIRSVGGRPASAGEAGRNALSKDMEFEKCGDWVLAK